MTNKSTFVYTKLVNEIRITTLKAYWNLKNAPKLNWSPKIIMIDFEKPIRNVYLKIKG